DIGDDVVARDQLEIDLADDGDVAQLLGKGQRDGVEALVAGKLGRIATALEPGLAQKGGQTGSEEVERHAGNGLVAFEIDRGKAVNAREHQSRANAGEEAKPGRAGDGGHGGGGKSAGQQFAFKADIDDAGTLGIKTGETGKDQRD